MSSGGTTSRCARRGSSGILGLDRSLLDADPTAALGQNAVRPLAARLRADRLGRMGVAMRGVGEGGRVFAAARAAVN